MLESVSIRASGDSHMRRLAILALILCLLPVPAEQPAAGAERADFVRVFDEAWRLTRDRFYDKTMAGLDWSKIGDRYRPQAEAADSAADLSAVINRMLAELGASHTGHYTATDPAYYQLADIFSHSLRDDLKRHFPNGEVAYPGIGIFTRDIAGQTFVSGVLHDLPAAKAGLLVGDEILAVDGQPFQPVASFADKTGQSVTLRIRRKALGSLRDIVVTPVRIEPNEAFRRAMQASVRLIEVGNAKVGYVRIWSYAGEQYQNLLEREIGMGRLRDADALIWDLRDGWGGAQPGYFDIFNGRSPTMTVTGRNGDVSVVNAKWRKPAVMLIDGGTRSGKEVLAHGFKTYGYGDLVGTRTAGALLAGRAFLLADGSLLLLAVSDVSVDGERLEGVGVTPTVEVPFDLPYAAGGDPQLDRAVELLMRKLGD